MKQEKSCGALIFRKHNTEIQVLIIRQVQGHWCFPKGHVEHNETEQQTALREIREETGLKVELTDIFRHSLGYSPKEGVYKEVVYFIAVHPEGVSKVQEEELSEMAWVSINEARQLITYDNDAALLEKAVACLRKHPEVLS